MNKPYKYKLRPGYGSKELLIEFSNIEHPENFIKKLISILKNHEFEYNGTTDVWMNDEVLIHLKSSNGKLIISKDIYDFIFILGDHNQKDIEKIAGILMESDLFEKEIDDYLKYQISNK